MIKELRLQNVRLFGDTQTSFALAPLTVFTGTNSSGKSTILKILPLLRQTQGISESATTEDGKLRLKGGQVDLGTYESLVTNNDRTKHIGIGFTFSATTTPAFIRWLKAIQAKTVAEFTINSAETNMVSPYQLKCFFEFSPDIGIRPRQTLSGALHRATFEFRVENASLLSWRLSRVDQSEGDDRHTLFRLSLPKAFWDATGMNKYLQPLEGSDIDEVDHIAAVRGILPAVIMAQSRVQKERGPTGSGEADPPPSWERWPLPFLLENCLTDLKTSLERTHYVGPLRSPGKRIYLADYDLSPGLDPDPTGEFLPYILRDKGEDKIINCRLGKNCEAKEETLVQALNYWLAYLRTADTDQSVGEQVELDLSTTDRLVELKLQSSDGSKKFSLADSGFGYSQILPVVTRGLLTEVNGTLVVEQPELHLHPALQVRLASFFVTMARCGKQVVVESHSEHLVNAIRVAIAENSDGSLAPLCNVYFLELRTDEPVIHKLSVKENGTVDEIPRSFFGEALELSGRLLRAQKKQSEKP